jgi:hypothetical protein
VFERQRVAGDCTGRRQDRLSGGYKEQRERTSSLLPLLVGVSALTLPSFLT